MTNQEAYKQLTDRHVHWDRKDSNHIIVWTSGYKTADHRNIAKFLLQAKMVLVNEEFDNICGKTKGIFKHS